MGIERMEITKIIERFELVEEKFCIAISGLYATGYPSRVNGGSLCHVEIKFDLISLRKGGKMKRDFWVNASAYNTAGQLLEERSERICAKTFMGFQPISIDLSDLLQAPTKIRLFPLA